MIRICIDEVLVVRGLASDDETRWRDRVRFKNPKYAASARYTRDRKPSRNIQPTIALGGHLLDGGLLLPRGVLADLRMECPDAALDDRTACPSIHLQTSGALVPRDYQRMLSSIRRAHEQGLTGDEAIMVAFEENARDLARVGGN